jgi:hypothetical protein
MMTDLETCLRATKCLDNCDNKAAFEVALCQLSADTNIAQKQTVFLSLIIFWGMNIINDAQQFEALNEVLRKYNFRDPLADDERVLQIDSYRHWVLCKNYAVKQIAGVLSRETMKQVFGLKYRADLKSGRFGTEENNFEV